MMGDSLDPITSVDSLPPANDQATVQISAAEVSALVNLIKKVVPPILEEDAYLQPSLVNLLDDIHIQEKLRKFITDPQIKSLLIQRISTKGECEGTDSCRWMLWSHLNHIFYQFIELKMSSIQTN